MANLFFKSNLGTRNVFDKNLRGSRSHTRRLDGLMKTDLRHNRSMPTDRMLLKSPDSDDVLSIQVKIAGLPAAQAAPA